MFIPSQRWDIIIMFVSVGKVHYPPNNDHLTEV